MPVITVPTVVPPSNRDDVARMYGIGIAQAKEAAQMFKSFGKAAIYSPGIGFASKGYNPDAFPNEFSGYEPSYQWDGRMSSSLVNMPIMCYLKFVGNTYVDLQGNELTLPTVIFDTVLMTVTMSKDIKKTSIRGRNTGTIKEDNGIQDWKVDIRAIITADSPVNDTVERRNQDGTYPRENMQEIYQLLIAPIAIEIECWFLQMFGIKYLMIEDGFNTDQVEGEYGMVRLTIPCISDNPLIIKKGR